MRFQNYLFKKYIFKIAPPKNTSAKLLLQIIKNKFSKCVFKITCLKNTFSKLLAQKKHF